MQVLQYSHRNLTLLEGSYALGRGSSGGDSGERRDAMRHGGPPNGLLVKPWILSLRSVDHKLDTVTLDQVDHIRTAFLDLVNAFHSETGVLQNGGSSVSSYDVEAEFCEAVSEVYETALVSIGNADKDGSIRRQCLSGGELGLGEGFAKAVTNPHNLARRLHLRAEHRVDAWELSPWKYRTFYKETIASIEI